MTPSKNPFAAAAELELERVRAEREAWNAQCDKDHRPLDKYPLGTNELALVQAVATHRLADAVERVVQHLNRPSWLKPP